MSDPNSSATATTAPPAEQRTRYTYWQPGDTGFVAGTRGQVKTMQRPGTGDCSTGASRNLCTSYTYDGLARTTTQTDGRNKVTRYSYDVMDRTTQSLADGATTCQPNTQPGQGTCIRYTYDSAGNLTRREDAQGPTVFGYDRLNRRTSQTTPDAVTVGYGYTLSSLLAQITQTVPGVPTDTVNYEYNPAGKVSAVKDATGNIAVEWDRNQRLSSTIFPSTGASAAIDRTYTRSGQPKLINVRSGTSTYDGMTDYHYTWTKNGKDTNQLQKLTVDNSTAAINYDAEFAYNQRGQLTGETRTNGGGGNYSYTYDNAGNLKTATRPNAGPGNTTTHYGYDFANQLCWTQTVAPANNSDYSKLTCPTAAPNPASGQVVARDAAGNSQGDPANLIAYNARNQAASVAGQSQGYLDEGNDLRVTAGDTRFVNTSAGITARTTNAGTSSAATTFYTRMPDGRLLSSHRAGVGTSGTFFYVTDRKKSVVGLIDAAGQRAGTYRYDPYGKTSQVEGTSAEANNPFRYISGYQDNNEQPGGYLKLGARFYNPDTAAFTQPDPELGNMGEPLRTNAYVYAAGDPSNKTDASGREFASDEEIIEDCATYGGIAALVGAYSGGVLGAAIGGIGGCGASLIDNSFE